MAKKALEFGFTQGLTPLTRRPEYPSDYKLKSGDIVKAAQAYNAKNPDDPIDFDNDFEKRGAFASVMKTRGGRIVKMDTSPKESELLGKLPPNLRSLRILPQDVKLDLVDTPSGKKFHTINREDIEDLKNPNIAHAIEEKLNPHIENLFGLGYEKIPTYLHQAHLQKGLRFWHTMNQNHPEYSDEEKDHLKRFARDYSRLVNFGVVPGDLRDVNLGQRPDGSIVIRDLGFHRVLDKPKFATRTMLASPIRPASDRMRKLVIPKPA